MSATERWLDDAAAYALGQLEGEALVRFEKALASGDPAVTAALAEFAPSAARIGLALPSGPPSVRLKRRLLSRVGDESGYYFMTAAEGEWELPAPGVRWKRLFVDPDDERETRWIELAPGEHAVRGLVPAASGVIVLSGSIELGGEALHARDWHRVASAAASASARASEPSRIVVFEPTARRRAEALPARSVRASDGRWRELGGGTFARVLEVDRSTRGSVMEVRMQPGATMPAHTHEGPEQVLMIEGECDAMGRTFHVHDYHRAWKGSSHDGATTTRGCRMINLIEGPMDAK